MHQRISCARLGEHEHDARGNSQHGHTQRQRSGPSPRPTLLQHDDRSDRRGTQARRSHEIRTRTRHTLTNGQQEEPGEHPAHRQQQQIGCEQPTPTNRVGEGSPVQRTDCEGEAGSGGPDTHRCALLGLGEHQADQGQLRRQHQTRGHALEGPAGHQNLGPWGGCDRGGTHREQTQADSEHPATSEYVAELSASRDRGGSGQQVGVHRPCDSGGAHLEVLGDDADGGVDPRGVETDYQQAPTEGYEDPPGAHRGRLRKGTLAARFIHRHHTPPVANPPQSGGGDEPARRITLRNHFSSRQRRSGQPPASAVSGQRSAEHHLLEEGPALHGLLDAVEVDAQLQVGVEVVVHRVFEHSEHGMS